MIHRNCYKNHKDESRSNKDCSLNHQHLSMNHKGCSLNPQDWSLIHQSRSMIHQDCYVYHKDESISFQDCALNGLLPFSLQKHLVSNLWVPLQFALKAPRPYTLSSNPKSNRRQFVHHRESSIIFEPSADQYGSKKPLWSVYKSSEMFDYPPINQHHFSINHKPPGPVNEQLGPLYELPVLFYKLPGLL